MNLFRDKKPIFIIDFHISMIYFYYRKGSETLIRLNILINGKLVFFQVKICI